MKFIFCVLGYDKLKTYGFAIHGAICGYSRRILWLEVLRSNTDPKIIAGIYIDTVKDFGGCPQREDRLWDEKRFGCCYAMLSASRWFG